MLPESQPLSVQERSIRDKFAAEYITDYDQIGAAVRVGYANSYAQQFAAQFMQEPYTRLKIKELEESQGGTSEKEQHRRRATTLLYREASNYKPGGSSRVAAVAGLRSLHGLDEPALSKIEMTTKQTTVQFYIPSNGRDVQEPEPGPPSEPEKNYALDLFA